jgi:hypothetical protein
MERCSSAGRCKTDQSRNGKTLFLRQGTGRGTPYTIGTEVSARVPSVRFYLLAFAGVVFGANGTMIRTGS